MRTLILGIGNSIRKDDAVGIIVAKKLYERLLNKENIDFEEFSFNGWRLPEILRRYDKVIIIDTIPETKDLKLGECYKVEYDINKSHSFFSSHNVDILEGVQLAKSLGYNLPEISLYAVVVKDTLDFGEEVSQEILCKIENIVDEIYNEEFLCMS